MKALQRSVSERGPQTLLCTSNNQQNGPLTHDTPRHVRKTPVVPAQATSRHITSRSATHPASEEVSHFPH
ncbi:hypothetical protein E2C01_018979 [Portunus trituberculatus]|uniref:Uncharacterized protein n=1 Tax=Portunus trituberculatus TaxID=210409 RepID=A0A5B7DXY3_PORTR|nr:hypothetical protein [Portunus trituberculatus]